MSPLGPVGQFVSTALLGAIGAVGGLAAVRLYGSPRARHRAGVCGGTRSCGYCVDERRADELEVRR